LGLGKEIRVLIMHALPSKPIILVALKVGTPVCFVTEVEWYQCEKSKGINV
jgi:hypothetical protein